MSDQDQPEREYRRKIIEEARETVRRLTPLDNKTWAEARSEHAWLLRAEGYTLQLIADRLDISRERARGMIDTFGWRVQQAIEVRHLRMRLLFQLFDQLRGTR